MVFLTCRVNHFHDQNSWKLCDLMVQILLHRVFEIFHGCVPCAQNAIEFVASDSNDVT